MLLEATPLVVRRRLARAAAEVRESAAAEEREKEREREREKEGGRWWGGGGMAITEVDYVQKIQRKKRKRG